MIKFRRILALAIDGNLISLFFHFIYVFISKGISKGLNVEIITGIIFIPFEISLFLLMDSTGQKRSVGKKIMGLSIKYKDKEEEISNKDLVLRNLICWITFPISIILLIFYNTTLGDYFTKTIVEKSSVECKKQKKLFVGALLGRVIIVNLSIIILYSLIIYLFLQKINYYSLRNLLAFLLLLIFILILKLLNHYLIIKRRKVEVIKYINCGSFALFSLILILLYHNVFEESFIKKSTMISSFQYSFPCAEIIKSYDLENYGFVFFVDDYGYDIVSYTKKGSNWPIKYPYYTRDVKQGYVESLEDNKSPLKTRYKLFSDTIWTKSVSLVILQSFNKIDKIEDSFSSNFENFMYNNVYYYVAIVDSFIGEDYYIEVDGQKYN